MILECCSWISYCADVAEFSANGNGPRVFDISGVFPAPPATTGDSNPDVFVFLTRAAYAMGGILCTEDVEQQILSWFTICAGPIPKELGDLQSLTYVNLHSSNVIGKSFPIWFGPFNAKIYQCFRPELG